MRAVPGSARMADSVTRPPSPFGTVPQLFLWAADSDLRDFLEEVHQLIVGCPALVARVEEDLDAHGKGKKAIRLADEEWRRRRTEPLPGSEKAPAEVDTTKLVLEQGRPRTPAYVVIVALLLRGYFGAGFKSCDSTTMLQESITLRVMLEHLGMKLPGRSTLTELVNAVTNKTRQSILDAQIAMVIGLAWDNFSTMLQDSTHTEGNTAWPTESQTLVALVARLLRVGGLLPRFELPAIVEPKADKHLEAMRKLAREIALAPRTKDRARTRRRKYAQLLWRAKRVLGLLREAVNKVQGALRSLDVLPSRHAMATRVVARLASDVESLAKVIAQCEARVIHEAKVPAADKVLSVSDPDVAMICKGQRIPVVG